MIEQIKENIYWLGVVDWGLREFHGHELSTHRGSTYNSYLIKDEKNVLIDTVWDPYEDEFISNLKEVINPEELDYIIINHSEVDHSGALPRLLAETDSPTIITSTKGEQILTAHYHEDWELEPVATGDQLDIGEITLNFVEAPMLHWPDSMFTYAEGAGVLFPNDAFGQHYATGQRFNDQVDQEELFEEALKYYVNILTPFSSLVERKIEEIEEMELALEMIAPSHGVIWREDPGQIVKKYKQWAAQEPEEKAVVLYDSMWGATRKMANAIGEGIVDAGVDCKVIPAATTDRNDALVEIFKAKTVVVGSSTVNSGVLPSITPLLEDLRGLKFKNKLGAAFGSYGWSGESTAKIKDHFEESGFELAEEESISCKWQPDEEEIQNCQKFGRHLAKETSKKV
ncbi:MAG: MBL fold metallo-hydrolase [bacterium]